ncbi:hypothetical protein [Nitrosopumilus zosterae]|uniref:hypothetical protein n=1 Tax=Nitrosopumilus zosterae TaxID=718286 RepID=UPI001358DAFA|nr:hypothetical protein [Nitrosopumilus zosterae]BDQ30373.1 hypothetical protein NZOSNM25_000475 [Nitrosopumilus zosterae]
MQVVVSCECVPKSNLLPTVVGSEAKNPLPISKGKYSESMGLSCLVADDFEDFA